MYVMCECVLMCGCFGNMCTCIYCVFVLFRLCTEWAKSRYTDALLIGYYTMYCIPTFDPLCIFILVMLLFNFVSYSLLLLCLYILILTCVLFCIFPFHRASWHSSTTLTEVFPSFILSCKANARV